MKTAIITFHRALNYGAILQSYALEKTIWSLNVPCEIIDYRCKFMEEFYKPFALGYCKNVSEKIKKCIKSPQLAKKRKAFDAFSSKYLTLTSPCKNRDELLLKGGEYDCIITGSDQVFNPDAAGGDFSYFIDFAKEDTKKIAYGASLGYTAFPKEHEKKCVELLGDFKGISIREKSACDGVAKITGKEVENVLDPTLLFEASVWRNIAKTPSRLPEKYILVYMMEGCKYTIEKARELAKEKGCQLVLINPTLNQQRTCRDFVMYTSASPEEVVGMFEKATVVVTNSFHGVAFSLIFGKEFYAETSNEKKASRIVDILELLGLSDRLLPECGGKEICWDKVKSVLDVQREKSVLWLENALKN